MILVMAMITVTAM